MTQSLGNMVACEALRQGLYVGKYFMFDAAVATEAIDATLQNNSDDIRAKYVKSDWRDYDPLSWSANWFRWFAEGQTDARGKIGWPGRFTDALENAAEVYNYYSSGDEVFHEMDNPPWLLSRMDESSANYCWQKQETLKGSRLPGGTACGGWGFHEWESGLNPDSYVMTNAHYSALQAAAMVADGSVTNNPVFNRGFEPMFDRDMSQDDQWLALAKYVPAVSHPVGGNAVGSGVDENIDMNTTSSVNGVPRPNGWGRDHPYFGANWFHSDLTRAVGFSKGAWAKTCFSIVDQDNLPVEEARIYGGFTLGARDKCGLVDGVTDTNGGFIAEGKCNDWLHYSVTKDGYYMAEGDVKYLDTKFVPAVVDGKWQPYGDVRKISLKRIKNPFLVTVFGESRSRRQIPKFGEWIGFDLEDGDWVSPYGRGKHKDVLLRFMADVRKRRVDYTYVMDVSFTNNPYAGAYVMRKDNGSDLKTEYCADTNATYKTEFSFRTKCLPGKRFEDGCLDGGSYLIFRTRTRVDERGLLVGAHYGKINGVWRSTNSEMLISDGCFNPRENDTNIEGDQELLYKLKNYKK